jgi:SAM-dependent methyltransferase
MANSHYDQFWGDEIAESDHSYWSEARARMHQDFVTTFLAESSGRLLDMGCGLGYFLKAIQPYPNWDTYGREISPAAVRYARDTLGLKNVICSRLEDTDLPQDSFNLITMWDVIEHIPTPDPVLRRCHSLLTSDGICFIRTPNVHLQLLRARVGRWLWRRDHGYTYLQPRDHAHHYSMRSIRQLLERNGFTRIEFLHLHPIQGGFGNWSGVTRVVKNTWFQLVRGLTIATAGRMNLDNLFVIARKDH